ncbi:MAG TPA: DCC1-like thiol-disulfide oxidoreductase family protein [Pyrinomonadaceae bacterium]|nr:DCC1-like thiol-disulfide oxidoreductase family protein [Pyrinomonadaceae bacterium]
MTQDRLTKSRRPILFFDSHCLLCDGSVRFVLRHERRPLINFAPINGKAWREIFGAGGGPEPAASVVLIDEAGVHTKSKAVIRIQRHMGGAWKWFGALSMVVPSFVRDFFYDIIARNRYTWFGRTDECLLPTPENRSRFLQ